MFFFNKIREFCLFICVLCILGGNIINYFYFHLYLNNEDLQWRFYEIVVSLALFSFSTYMWITENKKGNEISKLIIGWVTLFLFVNFIGVLLGYHLHTVGFMIILGIILFSAFCHTGYKIYSICKTKN
jgi:hypothetical protein